MTRVGSQRHSKKKILTVYWSILYILPCVKLKVPVCPHSVFTRSVWFPQTVIISLYIIYRLAFPMEGHSTFREVRSVFVCIIEINISLQRVKYGFPLTSLVFIPLWRHTVIIF